MTVTVVGVRHHSPACARLVAQVIDELRPAFVLIEGPSNMNERLAELALPHQLPIALYSYAATGAQDLMEAREPQSQRVRRASFYPFASHSPEWVALTEARRVGARALFIDLPAEDPAFDELENHYSDRHLRGSLRLHELAARLGFDDSDALWDHLFEQEQTPAALAPRLRDYFRAVRADEPGSGSDQRRERFMAQYVAWAVAQAQARPVVVVCGGYHAPVIERDFPTLTPERPSSSGSHGFDYHGIFLVPFSFQRLDSFSGYAAGMPSPAFCAAVWEHGPAQGGARMLTAAIAELRKRNQLVSVADAVAAATMAEALGRLRGHACPVRTDLLDGVAAALVKEALVAPLPWLRRGPLESRTHPILQALLEVFSGTQRGRLAVGTPRPPLVDDAHAELARVGVPKARSALQFEVALHDEDGRGRGKSMVLHRLRVIGTPGVRLLRAPRLARQGTQLGELWEVARGLDFDPALIEAAAYGPTLAQATLARLEEAAHRAPVGKLAELVHDAALAGMAGLSENFLYYLQFGLSREPDLSELGRTLARLLRIVEDSRLLGVELSAIALAIDAALQRGLWLFEAIKGPTASAVKGHVDAAVALRDAVRWLAKNGHGTSFRTVAELAERQLRDPAAPPYLRGVATGLRTALAADLGEAGLPLSDDELVRAFRGMPKPSYYGDFLLGLFALAREQLGENDALFTAILSAVEDLDESTFLGALPALRQALNYFPPRERVPIAERVLARYGGKSSASILAPIAVDVVILGRQRELAVSALARRFGLGDPP